MDEWGELLADYESKAEESKKPEETEEAVDSWESWMAPTRVTLPVESSVNANRRIRQAYDTEGLEFYSILNCWQGQELVLPNGDVPCLAFLDAVKTFLTVLDAFGAPFKLARRDLNKHVVKVREASTRHNADTLKKLMEVDGQDGEGTDNLNWLKRVLQFSTTMMSTFLSGETLPQSVENAYKETLYYCHPRIVRTICSRLRFITPDASTFCQRIYAPDSELVILGMRELLFSMRPVLEVLVDMTNSFDTEEAAELRVKPAEIPQVILASIG